MSDNGLRLELERRVQTQVNNRNEINTAYGWGLIECPELSEMSDVELLDFYDELLFRNSTPVG